MKLIPMKSTKISNTVRLRTYYSINGLWDCLSYSWSAAKNQSTSWILTPISTQLQLLFDVFWRHIFYTCLFKKSTINESFKLEYIRMKEATWTKIISYQILEREKKNKYMEKF